MHKNKTCGFCGRKEEKVSKCFISRVNGVISICNYCVSSFIPSLPLSDKHRALEVLSRIERLRLVQGTAKKIKTPKQITAFLDQHVIGQKQAKKVLAVAAHNHLKRAASKNESEEMGKSNVLLLGPTGTGKTFLARTLAKCLDVPFYEADITRFTEAGYTGDDVEDIILGLLMAADFNVEKAQRGVIYIDEVDKISRREAENTRGVSDEGVQQALLKIIEGTKVTVYTKGSKRKAWGEVIEIDTRNILFIFGGAFVGLEKIITRRDSDNAIGFGSVPYSIRQRNSSKTLKRVQTEDLIAYGLIPEFIGRIPVIATLEELTQKDLVRILTEPKNSLIKQYEALFAFDGIELIFGPGVLEKVADKALRYGSGARGLRSIIEKIMLDPMYELGPPDLEKLANFNKFSQAMKWRRNYDWPDFFLQCVIFLAPEGFSWVFREKAIDAREYRR